MTCESTCQERLSSGERNIHNGSKVIRGFDFSDFCEIADGGIVVAAELAQEEGGELTLGRELSTPWKILSHLRSNVLRPAAGPPKPKSPARPPSIPEPF